MTTEYCKSRITALGWPIRVSSSSFCFPSLVNTTTKDTLTFPPVSVMLHSLVLNTEQGFSKDEYPSFGSVDFHPSVVTCSCKVI